MTAVNVGAAYLELGVKYDDTVKRVGDDIASLDKTAQRTALQVGEHFTRGFGTVRAEGARTADDVGRLFSSGLTKGVGEAFSGVTSKLGEFGSAASSTFSGLASGAGVAALGVAGIGAAVVAVGNQLYDLGTQWDSINDSITIKTGLTGAALDKVTDSVKRVGAESAASLEQIASIEAQLTSVLHLTGGTLDEVALKLADLQELTGDDVNIRQLGQVFHGFNTDASEMGDNLDQLYDAYTRTQIPVSELVTMLRDAGPVARVLNIDIGQMAGLLVTLNDAGVEPTQTINGLRIAIGNLSKEKPPQGVLGDFLKAEDGKDIKTKLEDLIATIHDTRNIDLAKSTFGRGWSQIYDAITNNKLNADNFNQSMVTTGHTIEDTKKATEDWQEELQKATNRLKSDLAPAATAVFDGISHSIEGAINLLDSFTLKVSSLPVPGTGPGAQLPGVNLPTGPYAQPPGVNVPGIPGLPSSGANQGLGGALANGVPLTPGQQQGLMRGTATPGMIQWQVYDPSTGKWTTQEQPKPPVPEPKPPPPPAPSLPPPTSELDTGGAAGSKGLPQAPSLPYNTALPPGFLQLPQTTALLSAESGFIDARHDVEEKQARVDQLAQDNNATENDIQNARNDLYQAQVRQQQSELKLYDARQNMFDQENKRAEAQNKKIEDETKKYESQFSGGSLIDFLLYLIFQPGIDAIRQKIHAPEDAAAAQGVSGSTLGLTSGLTSLFTSAGTGATAVAGGGAGGLNLSTIPIAAQKYANDCIDASARIILSHSGIDLSEDQIKDVIAPGGSINSLSAGLNQLNPQGNFVPLEGSGGSKEALWGAIKASIDNGTGSVLNVAPGSSLAGNTFAEGHFIAATGYNPDGTINVSDTARGTQYSVTAADAFQATRGRGIVAGTGVGPPPIGGVGGGGAGGGGGGGLNWDALAAKESGGNWGIDTGNGYSGGLQFDAATWAQYGGTQFAPKASLASRDQQIAIAQRAFNARGGGSSLWPQNYQQLFLGFQEGGQVPGWGGGDQWPILTEGGEVVINKDAAQKNAAALAAINSGANSDELLQQLADQGQLPGAQHLPPGGPQPIGAGNGVQSAPATGRTGGYIPAGAGASGQAGSSLFSGTVGIGAEAIDYLIDTGASLAQEAASAAIAAGTFGAGAAAGPAASFGIQTAADIAKRGVNYGAQVIGIIGDSAAEILSPFGVPRIFQTDPHQFVPQIGALPAAITTAEKAQAGKDAGGPVQPGQLPGAQPVGPSAQKAQPGGVPSLSTPPIQGVLDNLTPKIPGARAKASVNGAPSLPPSAQAGALASSAPGVGPYDANSAGVHNDFSVHVQATVKDVNELQQKLDDKQRLQMMRYAGRPS